MSAQRLAFAALSVCHLVNAIILTIFLYLWIPYINFNPLSLYKTVMQIHESFQQLAKYSYRLANQNLSCVTGFVNIELLEILSGSYYPPDLISLKVVHLYWFSPFEVTGRLHIDDLKQLDRIVQTIHFGWISFMLALCFSPREIYQMSSAALRAWLP